MKRSQIIVGLAVLTCLVAGSATVVCGQLQSKSAAMPVGQPFIPPVPGAVVPPLLPNTGTVVPTTGNNGGAVALPLPPNMGPATPPPQTNIGAVVPANPNQNTGAVVPPSPYQTTGAFIPPISTPGFGTVVPPAPTPFGEQPQPAVKQSTVPMALGQQGAPLPANPQSVLPQPVQLPGVQAPLVVPEGKPQTAHRAMVPEMQLGQMEFAGDPQNPSAMAENPSGHQEPAVSVEWIGPPTARLNQATPYQIVTKNISNATVHNVIVRYRIPAAVRIASTEPVALNESGVLTWDLGAMLPGQEKRVELQMLPEAKAVITCQASVTFTGSTSFKVQVREPKLAIKATAPEQVLLGDVATVSLNVNNSGDGTADRVRIKAMLPEGLEHARGRTFELDLGSLAPGENRAVQLVCQAQKVGSQVIDCLVQGDAGLVAQDATKLEVVIPGLDLSISGPKLRYLDRHAIFVLKISNPGSAQATNVSVVNQLPQGFKFLAASHGGRHDFTTRTVTWFVGDLAAGESREVTFEAVAVTLGDHRQQAVATAARGFKAESEITTKIEGLSALLMEMIDTEDPIEVGAETSYEIRVTNTGSKTETNLELVCTIPEKMEFRGAKCAAGCSYRVEGRDVIFEVLPRLAPRADVLYRVVVKGLAPGDMRFRARIRADGLSEPVLREESTKVYGDEKMP